MSVQPIIKMGNPILTAACDTVKTFNTPTLHDLVLDLFDTMDKTKGVGLAAPQIGENLRVMVFGFDSNPRYPYAKPIPRTVLINPTLTPLTEEETLGWEGCISIPGLRGVVSRYKAVRYSGFDIEGNFFEKEAEGFHARVVQHEVDHLNGILFIHRIKNCRLLGFEEEVWQWANHNIIPDELLETAVET